MGLPKIDMPIFEMELPSTGEKIKYRQYTVKEEKILLVAKESKENGSEILAMKQVVNNCLLDKEVTDLAMFDLEYVHLMLRSKSVDNTMSFTIKDPDTEEDVRLTLDTDYISLTKDKNHSREIKINDQYILFLKYPNIDSFLKIAEIGFDDPLVNYAVMVSCLDYLASDDEVIYFKDHSQEDIDNFMNDLTGDVMKQIQKFFETMPKLRHELPYKNKNGDEKKFVLEGLKTFFM